MITACKKPCRTLPAYRGGGSCFYHNGAFTLVELLVVIAIIGLLISILLPSLARAKFIAKVVKTKAELAGIATALTIYHHEHNAYPPARTYCAYGCPEKVKDWAELPIELARGGYLPAAPPDSHLTVQMTDPFNPDRTYKYLAPGPGFHNKVKTITGIWVPDGFPPGDCTNGKTYTDPKKSPVKFVIWSVGTFGDIGYWQALQYHHPLCPSAWYSNKTEKGLILRARTADKGDFVPN